MGRGGDSWAIGGRAQRRDVQRRWKTDLPSGRGVRSKWGQRTGPFRSLMSRTIPKPEASRAADPLPGSLYCLCRMFDGKVESSTQPIYAICFASISVCSVFLPCCILNDSLNHRSPRLYSTRQASAEIPGSPNRPFNEHLASITWMI